jgi:hypothetical protein
MKAKSKKILITVGFLATSFAAAALASAGGYNEFGYGGWGGYQPYNNNNNSSAVSYASAVQRG